MYFIQQQRVTTKNHENSNDGSLDDFVLDEFIILKKIGKGAYGESWQVRNKTTQKEYTLRKTYRAFQNVTDQRRTCRELECLLNLSDHPYIVSCYDAFLNEKNDLYLLLEHKSYDLHEVSRANLLKDQHIRYIAAQITSALAYMHSKGYVHRDLKPSHLLVDEEVKTLLIDFSQARKIEDPEETSTKAVLTDYVCTRWYKAPELLLGSVMYSTAVDIWALGCIIAEFYLSKPIFPGTSTVNQLDRIIEYTGSPSKEAIVNIQSQYASAMLESLPVSPPINWKLWRKKYELPKSACNFISMCLQFDPTKRSTAKELQKHHYLKSVNKYLSPMEDRIPLDSSTLNPIIIEKLVEFSHQYGIYEQKRKIEHQAIMEKLSQVSTMGVDLIKQFEEQEREALFLKKKDRMLQVISESLENRPLQLHLKNDLPGFFPEELCQLSDCLQELYLIANHLVALPSAFGNLTSLQILHLMGNSITTLPEEFSFLVKLRQLRLEGNQIQKFPTGMEKFTNLVELRYDQNELREIPSEVFKLIFLTRLDVGSNFLTEIPGDIGKLVNLNYLDLSSNTITKYHSLASLSSSLQYLYLRNNNLQELPPEVYCLTSLSVLNLAQNQLRNFSPDIIFLKNLTQLELTENKFSEFPKIESLSNLSHLTFESNQLSEIPSNMDFLFQKLKTFSISYNSVKKIPPSLARAPSLEELWCIDNGISYFPKLFSESRITKLRCQNNPLQIDEQGIRNIHFSDYHDKIRHYGKKKIPTLLHLARNCVYENRIPDKNLPTDLRHIFSEIVLCPETGLPLLPEKHWRYYYVMKIGDVEVGFYFCFISQDAAVNFRRKYLAGEI